MDMPAKPAPVMDLSKIRCEALRSGFKESKDKNTDPEVLKAAIRVQLEKLIRLYQTRADPAAKCEALIKICNAGSRNIEELLEELVKPSRNLTYEQQRHVLQNMTEQEPVKCGGDFCRRRRRQSALRATGVNEYKTRHEA